MKYGETLSDILYLSFVIISGICLLSRSKKSIMKIKVGVQKRRTNFFKPQNKKKRLKI